MSDLSSASAVREINLTVAVTRYSSISSMATNPKALEFAKCPSGNILNPLNRFDSKEVT